MMRGVPLATVSNLLGHTSPNMTLRYAHLSPKHLTSAVRALDKFSHHSSATNLSDKRQIAKGNVELTDEQEQSVTA